MPQPVFIATKTEPKPAPAAVAVVEPPPAPAPVGNVQALDFAQCAEIFEHQLRRQCRLTHEIEVVQRRCEKGFFIRSRSRPSMAEPVRIAYALRDLPAWRNVRFIVGVFLESVGGVMDAEEVETFMVSLPEIPRLKWIMEGGDLFIQPRHESSLSDAERKRRGYPAFDAAMMEKLESIGGHMERQDHGVFAVYVEIQVPLTH